MADSCTSPLRAIMQKYSVEQDPTPVKLRAKLRSTVSGVDSRCNLAIARTRYSCIIFNVKLT